MSPQRQRMIEAMILAGLSEGTQAAYLRAVWQLAKHYRRAPDQLSEEEVRAYLLDLRQRGVARGTFEIARAGLRFFFCQTLDKAVSDAASAHCGRRWPYDRVGSWKQHRPLSPFRPVLTLRTLIRQVTRAPVSRGSMSSHAVSGGEAGRPSRSARSSWRASDPS
jgi:hypothetical protein